MEMLQIIPDPSIMHQRQTLNLDVQGITKRVIFELDYFDKTGKWYATISDAQNGEVYCSLVPIISSNSYTLDLLSPFYHKRIGWLVCYKSTDSVTTENPGKDNWGDFVLLWGGAYA